MDNLTARCENYAAICRETTSIPYEDYDRFQVKKGLRDKNGDGVRAARRYRPHPLLSGRFADRR